MEIKEAIEVLKERVSLNEPMIDESDLGKFIGRKQEAMRVAVAAMEQLIEEEREKKIKREITLTIGIFADSIEDQLKKQGYYLSKKDLEVYEKLIESWRLMRVNGFATATELDRIAKRIVSDIARRVDLIEEEMRDIEVRR